MTVTQVAAYRAEDGTLFPTEEDALIHNDWIEVGRVLKSRYGSIGAKLAIADSKNVRALFKITREVVMARSTGSADKQAGAVEIRVDSEAIDLLLRARACIKKLHAPDASGEHSRQEVSQAIKLYLNKAYGSTDWNVQSEPTKADPVIEQPTPER
jgi:hypothetical protein